MSANQEIERRLSRLREAFAKDGFGIRRVYVTQGNRIGIAALHKTAKNYDTGQKKSCYYLEGSPYERGYLLGLLAEPEIEDMAVKFTDNVIFDFIGLEFFNRYPKLQKLVVSLLYELSESTWLSMPQHVHEEANGVFDGCKRSNPRTDVTKQRLAVMNVGFDVLCAMVYTGNFLKEKAPELPAEAIKLTMMCNAFSAFGAAAPGEHFFARDFMFATGGVFQNHLAHILHLPLGADQEALYPHVSVTAPGIIGSISAMNTRGIAGGVNMSPAANCDPEAVGMNSLLLLRECILRGGSAAEASRVIINTKRGVAWNYALSDGTNDTACTVEAGASWPKVDFLSYPQKTLLPLLPDEAFLKRNMFAPFVGGGSVRWYGAAFPETYFPFNPPLWKFYQFEYETRIRLHPDAFAPDGFINRTAKEKNCPSNFYFAPERPMPGAFITGNHFLMPHLRLCAMDPWTALIARGNVNDIQWRYDQLNHQLRQEIQEKGFISREAAKRIAEFLAPYGNFPEYYKDNPKSRDKKQTRIEGCVSFFDLKRCTVESHYGYYADDWVKTTLPSYF